MWEQRALKGELKPRGGRGLANGRGLAGSVSHPIRPAAFVANRGPSVCHGRDIEFMSWCHSLLV